MGWSYSPSWPTKEALIAHLVEGFDSGEGGFAYKAVKHAVTTETGYSILWISRERTSPNGVTERYVVCALMQSGRGDGWGYKDMSEHDGPSYYSCPLSILKSAEPAPLSNYSVEWRTKVKAYHEAKKASRNAAKIFLETVAVGDEFEIEGANPSRFTLESRNGNRLVASSNGTRYSIPPRFLKVAKLVPKTA